MWTRRLKGAAGFVAGHCPNSDVFPLAPFATRPLVIDQVAGNFFSLLLPVAVVQLAWRREAAVGGLSWTGVSGWVREPMEESGLLTVSRRRHWRMRPRWGMTSSVVFIFVVAAVERWEAPYCISYIVHVYARELADLTSQPCDGHVPLQPTTPQSLAGAVLKCAIPKHGYSLGRQAGHYPYRFPFSI